MWAALAAHAELSAEALGQSILCAGRSRSREKSIGVTITTMVSEGLT
jgi:hypothetical protein